MLNKWNLQLHLDKTCHDSFSLMKHSLGCLETQHYHLCHPQGMCHSDWDSSSSPDWSHQGSLTTNSKLSVSKDQTTSIWIPHILWKGIYDFFFSSVPPSYPPPLKKTKKKTTQTHAHPKTFIHIFSDVCSYIKVY